MITPKKDLHFGNPLWTAYRTPKVPYDVLESDIKTDVVIIGAGISGAMMAEELTDAGFDVIILDRRAPGKGSTMATTALLQYEIDQPLSKLSKMIGMDKASQAWRRSKLSINALATRIKIMDIKCDLKREHSVYLNGDVLNIKALKHEQDLRNQIGLQTDFINRRELQDRFGIVTAGALESFDNFSANPYKLCAGFLNKAISRGAKIFAPVNVIDITSSPRQVKLKTEGGFTITARHAVFTTGYEVPKELKKQNFKINSTWAFATKPQKENIPDGLPLIWQASDPYLYMRATPDGRMICGGEDEEFTDEEKRNALTPQKIKKLQKKMAKILPDIDTEAEFAWSGSFGTTATGLPLIGAIPGLQNCYAVMAFGGNGITFSRIGAEIIRNKLTGKVDPDEGLFGFKK